jgi:hypothetical protein
LISKATEIFFLSKKNPTLGKVGHIKQKLVYGESDHHHIISM